MIRQIKIINCDISLLSRKHSDKDFHFDISDQPEGDSKPIDLITFKVKNEVEKVL
jgi:hypothetical protein